MKDHMTQSRTKICIQYHIRLNDYQNIMKLMKLTLLSLEIIIFRNYLRCHVSPKRWYHGAPPPFHFKVYA